MITRTEFAGWADNVTLSNGTVDLTATLSVGPRILRFGFMGGPNVLKQFPEQLGCCGEEQWQIRGGHRLWHAPEAKPRTYSPDNGPVELEVMGEFAVRLTPAPETENGIQKQIDIALAAEETVATVTHRITNTGPWPIELAPWALTVMDAGGLLIVPLPEKRSHTDVLTPEFPLVLWPYTDLADSRLRLGTRYITLQQDAAKGPTKFGMALQLGWAGYLVHGTLFVKYFDYEPEAPYPDYGCNFEAFTNEEMLEVESLGPMTLLEPGESLEHDETWQLFPDIPAVRSDAEIDRVVRPLIEG
jgi:hypothetical protein